MYHVEGLFASLSIWICIIPILCRAFVRLVTAVASRTSVPGSIGVAALVVFVVNDTSLMIEASVLAPS